MEEAGKRSERKRVNERENGRERGDTRESNKGERMRE